MISAARRLRPLLVLLAGLLALGCVGSAPAGQSPSAVVLEYHHVSTDAPASTSVDPETFEAHMDHLADNGFRIWPLPKLVETIRAGETVPEKTVALTFDDAYASVYTEVLPRMRERGWPFTVFVSTDYIDDEFSTHVTWDQLREMERHGATIANHSRTHAHLVRRKADESRSEWLARVRAEITDAQARLEAEMDSAPKLFAYPFGEFSPPIQEVVADLGYVGFGQQSGAFGPASDFTALPRFPLATAFAGLDSFALKVRSRPLPVRGTEPASGVLGPDDARPELRLTLDSGPFRPDAVRCYIGGQPAELEQVSEDPAVLSVRPPRPIGPGRTKYNCTAPSTDSDAWFWYSFVWMKPRPDGSWYEG
jgi:peptidoglycan/xylan/chitin deacetylase (PgdA/CDA1 family)